MKNALRVCLGVGVCMASLTLLAADGQKVSQKGKPGGGNTNSTFPVVVEFEPGGAIQGDGLGEYINGQEGVTAELQTSPDYQLRLVLGKVRKSIPRSLLYDYTQPVVTECDPDVSDDPVGTLEAPYSTTLNVAVKHLADMPVGSVGARFASFHTPVGVFRFHEHGLIDGSIPDHCGTLLVVTRTSTTTWTVTTDAVPGGYYENINGDLVQAPYAVGPTAQLDDFDTGELIGNYDMPLHMTITCLSTSVCPSEAGGQ